MVVHISSQNRCLWKGRGGGGGRVSMDKFTVLRKDKFTVIDIGEKEKYDYRDVPHLTKSIFSETV